MKTSKKCICLNRNEFPTLNVLYPWRSTRAKLRGLNSMRVIMKCRNFSVLAVACPQHYPFSHSAPFRKESGEPRKTKVIVGDASFRVTRSFHVINPLYDLMRQDTENYPLVKFVSGNDWKTPTRENCVTFFHNFLENIFDVELNGNE